MIDFPKFYSIFFQIFVYFHQILIGNRNPFRETFDFHSFGTVFKGNPKTYVLSCYSPLNSRPEEEVIDFYDKLHLTTQTIPRHFILLVLGDFNAKLEGKSSFHNNFKRNGNHLHDYALQSNLIVGNILSKIAKQTLDLVVTSWRSRSNRFLLIKETLAQQHS